MTATRQPDEPGCVGCTVPLAAAVAAEAARAADDGDLDAAHRLFLRAAALETDTAAVARLRAEAGAAGVLSGRRSARALLDAAAASADAVARQRAQHVIALVAAYSAGRDAEQQVAAAAAGSGPGAADVHVMAASRAASLWDADGMRHHLQQARRLAPGSRDAHLRVMQALATVVDGGPVPADLPATVRTFVEAPDPDRATPIAIALVHLGAPAAAHEVLTASYPLARRRADLPALAWIQSARTLVLTRMGDPVRAVRCGEEAIRLGHDAVGPMQVSWTHACLADAHARLGHGTACLGHARACRDAPDDARTGMHEVVAELAVARSETALGLRAPAAVRLAAIAARVREAGPVAQFFHAVLPELVEVQTELGDVGAARASLAELQSMAALPAAVQAAAVAYSAAFLADVDALDEAVATALRLLAHAPDPIAAARLRLLHGERLRRCRRNLAARDPLWLAYAFYRSRRMRPWAQRAARELVATGAVLPNGAPTPDDGLTAQERQIAYLVAEGATTKEVAAALFLSPKTIEAHLGGIYAKLGVHRRAALAALLLRRHA